MSTSQSDLVIVLVHSLFKKEPSLPKAVYPQSTELGATLLVQFHSEKCCKQSIGRQVFFPGKPVLNLEMEMENTILSVTQVAVMWMQKAVRVSGSR